MNEPGISDSPRITLDQFRSIQLRVGVVVTAEIHPQADRLVCLGVNLGESALRPIVAGIRKDYDPSVLIGRQVIVVANMEPAVIRGAESRGMVLCAKDDHLSLLAPDRPVPPGSSVS